MNTLNSKLKTDLTELIDKLEVQLSKIQIRKQQKLAEELLIQAELEAKKGQLEKGQASLHQIKCQIDETWRVLDKDYNINFIIKQENELKVKEA